ncbi:ferredoxin [Nocardia sp. R16R-3T]
MSMHLTLDRERCTSCGYCLIAAPEVFDLDDDAKAVLLQTDPPEDLRFAVEQAINDCPADVIAMCS